MLHEYLEERYLSVYRETKQGAMTPRRREPVHRLLDLGLFRADRNPHIRPVHYRVTPLGQAVAERIGLEPR